MRGSGAIAVLVAIALASSPAWAGDSSREQAARAFAAGDQAFAAGQNLAAARAYEAAYELEPLPEITFSTAQAYRRHYFEDPDVRFLERAQLLYRKYLKDEPTGSRRAHAITHLSNIAVILSERANEERSATEPAAAPTELLVSSVTPGALASIDGAAPRAVPLVEKVSVGPHEVSVSAPGFFALTRAVVAVEGRQLIVPADLEAKPGRLVVITQRGTDVWLDGRSVGGRSAAEGVDVPAGNHMVSVTAAGKRTATRSVRIARGATQTVRFDLESSTQRIAAHWLLGISAGLGLSGAVGTIVAGISEAQVTSARASTDNGRALTPEQARDSNAALERRDIARGVAVGAFSLGAITGLTGTLVLVFDRPGPVSADEAASRMHGVALVGTF